MYHITALPHDHLNTTLFFKEYALSLLNVLIIETHICQNFMAEDWLTVLMYL